MNSPTTDDLIGQRKQRLDIVESLKARGIPPYPSQSQKDATHYEVKESYTKYEGKSLSLAGRIMHIRKHGKILFFDLQDQSGLIQVAVKKDSYTEHGVQDVSPPVLSWSDLSLLDKGDFVQAHGVVGKTEAQAVTLFADGIHLLTKSVRPLPDKLEHKEDKFRRRYVDLTIHPLEKERFVRKSNFWEVSRAFLRQKGFIEVETPVLEYVTGGADAKPFITSHHELNHDFYLRISTELYQKRLIGGGFEKIFTFGPNFRNEGLSDEHLQEYYQIEWYWAYADYRENMELTKEMFREVAEKVYGRTKFETRGHTFDLGDEWQVIDYVRIINNTYGIDIFNSTDDAIQAVLREKGVELPGSINRNRLIDNLWKLIRKTISGPAFLVNEPAFMSPLAKSQAKDPRLTERYHVIIAGSELANGYSEINDPQEQLARFLDQQKMREAGDSEAQMLDIDYVEMLEYGMPPVSGHGHSERLFWFFENCTGREGTLFPLLKGEVSETTKKIYPRVFEAKRTSPGDLSVPHIIFDMDGVLSDSWDLITESFIDIGLHGKTREEVLKNHWLYCTTKPRHTLGEVMDAEYKKKVDDALIRVGKKLMTGAPLFDDFISEIKKIHGVFAVVSSNTKEYVQKKAKDTGIPFTHVLSWEDSPHKEEKIKKVCADWGISSGDVVYVTDTLADVFELERLLPREHIVGCAWGYCGYIVLREELDKEQILREPKDIHKVISNIKNKILKTSSSNAPSSAVSSSPPITKEQAIALMETHIQNKGLRNHCRAVGYAMKALANHFKGDPELWEIVGILHDADWEETKEVPHEHTSKTIQWLKGLDCENNILTDAILAHAHHVNGYREPKGDFEWSLFCCDELTGLIVANALIMPSKKLTDVTVDSVIKKMGSKSFAAAIDRDSIRMCEEKLGIALPEFVGIVLAGMQSEQKALGL